MCGFPQAPAEAGGTYLRFTLSFGVRPTLLNLGFTTLQLCELGQLHSVSTPLYKTGTAMPSSEVGKNSELTYVSFFLK